ncbi:hypothetical protein GCM10010104_17000 [Streptomyces indiaensis]|uniref:Uncharacterized protein n=1 Tax=Streptomyces indiaensis TaxID=284033 RepID=A0ABN3DA48_9ACTN
MKDEPLTSSCCSREAVRRSVEKDSDSMAPSFPDDVSVKTPVRNPWCGKESGPPSEESGPCGSVPVTGG